jgi:hypothetical protein
MKFLYNMPEKNLATVTTWSQMAALQNLKHIQCVATRPSAEQQ